MPYGVAPRLPSQVLIQRGRNNQRPHRHEHLTRPPALGRIARLPKQTSMLPRRQSSRAQGSPRGTSLPGPAEPRPNVVPVTPCLQTFPDRGSPSGDAAGEASLAFDGSEAAPCLTLRQPLVLPTSGVANLRRCQLPVLPTSGVASLQCCQPAVPPTSSVANLRCCESGRPLSGPDPPIDVNPPPSLHLRLINQLRPHCRPCCKGGASAELAYRSLTSMLTPPPLPPSSTCGF